MARNPWATPIRRNSRSPPVVQQKYDAETGQMFSEVEVRVNRKQYSDWIREPKTRSLVKKPRSNEHGARSLADMARIKVASQFRNLDPEHFETIPWSVAEKVWEQLLSTRGESFHAWRTLATAYPGAEEFGQPDHRYLLDIKQPLLPFADYFGGIKAPETSWLTCLRVSPNQLTPVDIVSIHTITNLVVLDLSDGQATIDNAFSKFDERIMRSWADLAASGQAFQHLRVMMFGWQDNLSTWIFKYVDRFPSLCHIIITDCYQMHQRNRGDWEPISQAAGWEARHAKRSAKSLRPIIGDRDFYFGSVSGCYYDSLELFSSLGHPRRPDLLDRLPALEVWLGTPRQWSHIVDDFPSTRTIFFENTKTNAWMEETQPSQISAREPAKRVRNQELASQGTTSPPPKRGTQGRPRMKLGSKNVMELLDEFKT